MAWMDVTVAVIFIVNGIRGWMKGFILSLLHLIGFALAWIIAKSYYPLVSAYIINNSDILLKIQTFIGNRLKNAAYEDAFTGGSPANNTIFDILKLPKSVEELFLKNQAIKDYSIRAVDGIYHYIAEIVARMFIDLVSILLIFIAVKLLLFLIGYLLNSIASLPVLREFNRLGGAIFGVFKGLLIVFIFLALLTPFAAMTKEGILMEGLEKSVAARYLYDRNPIINLLQGSVTADNATIDKNY